MRTQSRLKPEMREGSDDWFMATLVPVQSRVYAYIASLVPVRADAEDLFQQTVLTAWQKRRHYDQSQDFFGWICGIARNHVRHYMRSKRRSRLVLAPEIIDQLAATLLEETSYFQSRQAALADCLAKLGGKQRELVEHYYRSEQSVKNFANVRGASAESIYKSLQRIRAVLLNCVQAALAREGCT